MLAWGHASGVGLGSVLRLLCPWALGGGRSHKLGPGGKEVLRREARVAGKFFSFFWTVKLFTVFLQVFLNFNKEYMITIKHTHTHAHIRTHARTHVRKVKDTKEKQKSYLPLARQGVSVSSYLCTHKCTGTYRHTIAQTHTDMHIYYTLKDTREHNLKQLHRRTDTTTDTCIVAKMRAHRQTDAHTQEADTKGCTAHTQCCADTDT